MSDDSPREPSEEPRELNFKCEHNSLFTLVPATEILRTIKTYTSETKLIPVAFVDDTLRADEVKFSRNNVGYDFPLVSPNRIMLYC